MRPKVAAVLHDLEMHHWKPLIDGAVHRSPEQQRALVNAGRSKVMFSFHNCTSRTGTPESLAADIVDQRYGWEPPRLYWLHLAASALAHDLNSGIFFGLRGREAELRRALEAGRFDIGSTSLGWDPAHVHWRGISLTAAKLGKRPKA